MSLTELEKLVLIDLPPKSKKTDKKQIEELLYVSKVAVFFIDDKQQVRPNEIGSVDYIKEYAQKHGCELMNTS